VVHVNAGQAAQIRQTLGEVALVRARTRAALQALWFPSVLFGGLTLASAPIVFVWGGQALGWYWPFAAVIGAVLTSRFFHAREQELGLASRAGPYVVTFALLIVATMALGALGTGQVRVVGPPLAVSVGNLVFAFLARSRWLAVVAITVAVVTLALGALGHPGTEWMIALVYGSAFVTAGLVARATVERSA
jgi:hypothetical protein